MFTVQDLSEIDTTYFEIIRATGIAAEVRSRNTGHYWRIRSEFDYTGKKYICIVEHRHKTIYPYHYQCRAISLRSAVNIIKRHDRFQMAGRDTNVNWGRYVN